ncbi:bifunctional folylpolyglutamate synthase/dihydrofolate synthase [Miltoncostaea marina]|uniref:bifunctional folylpolyglutamate synthase/dihydrofolate synthase n=1 Tax=Miltoncostaea marina TaxID=2843215 RepID=UPI001C3CEBF3|nr:cyanophycin synthetase [Miltoncostaea marina]
MTPGEARAWIAGLEILGMRFGLERTDALLAALGDPQRSAPALHVVGTNGKSSTARLAAAVLASQGLRPGLYMSPHVSDWTERYVIDGAPLADAAFAAAAARVREAAEGLALPEGERVTQFEALTAIAFTAFRAAGADALVVEAGLGGRYDATNVLKPGAAVILTNVALEHTELLGDTEAAIAAEKLAVCADGHDRLVVGPLTPAARAAVDAECARRGLRPLRYGDDLRAAGGEGGVDVTLPDGRYGGLPLALRGGFQRENLAVAMAGARLVLGRPIDAGPLRPALAAVRMPGRLEVLPGAPPVLLDGAHNPAGMAALAGELPALLEGRRPVVAVTSVLADKDAAAMMGALAGVADEVIATRSAHRRAVPAGDLAATARGAARARAPWPTRTGRSPPRARRRGRTARCWSQAPSTCSPTCAPRSWRPPRGPLLHSRAPGRAPIPPRRSRP